ncbi:immunoglobulin-like and fibronectin type III domain-containing protein 1 isoform X2 [Paralichthys olivaceus]|uniref:immunoglobulin-like and fibronectin type III domain-containing protein 1 isoform X2 n=1 Tax=Paralichthys olivaceus TaxID=8255 RepID=UPI003751A10B
MLDKKRDPKAVVAIKKQSRVPGVVITQCVERVPLGKSTPDFTRKPLATTVQEGKKAVLKAMVSGEPAPTVTWERHNGEVDDPEKYKNRYDERAREHILEIPNVKLDQADTYRCLATNEFGNAVCTTTLSVTEVGLKKKGRAGDGQAPQDFRSMLKKTVVVTRKKQLPPKKEGEIDPKLWELLLSAPRKDYEKICLDFGVTDFRWMLKRLNQMKKEREDEQAKVIEKLENVKQIEVKPNGRAEFSLNMTLWDPNSVIDLYKDGKSVQYGDDETSKHSLKKTGTKYVFSIKDPQPEDAGFYQVDVEEANVLTTDFQVPAVNFVAKIKDAKAVESEDAIFQCVLSTPLNRITWSKQDSSLDHGDKYEITVSEDKLTHTLRVRDCKMADNGAYYAIAGITSNSASLTVEADPDGSKSREGIKTGDQDNLTKQAFEQEKDKRAQPKKDTADSEAAAALTDGGEGSGDGSSDGSKDGSGMKTDGDDGDNENNMGDTDDKKKKRSRTGPLVPDTVIDRGVQFVSGLSDTVANIGERAELTCKLSTDASEGRWYKNGKLLTNGDGVRIIKDGACHKLKIDCCKKDDTAVYRFEAEGRKSEATLNIQDPPKIDSDALGKFTKPVIIKAGENAEWKLQFSGGDPMNIQWYKDDDELLPGLNVKTETSATQSQLRLTKCQRKDSGEVKIKIKNEFGTTEATSRLIVLDKPTPPQGPAEIIESAVTSVEFKWKPPKDSGGCPITSYIIERQQVGRSKWTNLGEISGSDASYRDSDVDPGRRYCYRIRAKTSEGISDYLQTEAIAAGVLRYPGAPTAPKVISAFKDCINLAWSPPCDTGGTKIVGYNLEKNKKGTNYWSLVNQVGPITDTKYAVKDVFEGAAYEFRVSAINLSGAGDPSIPCDTVIARDPKNDPRPPGSVELDQNIPGTVTLSWSPSPDEKRDDRLHYMVSQRDSFKRTWRTMADNLFNNKFTVVNILPGREYYFRVFAKNDMGLSTPTESPVFENRKEKEKFKVNMPKKKNVDFQAPPAFIVPLKMRTAPQGYECHMSCAVKGDPSPRVTWYRNNINLNTNTNYHITNVCGVCSLLILRVGAKDNGEYKVVIENKLGSAECSMILNVRE